MLKVPVSAVCHSSEQHLEPSLHSAAVTEVVGWFLVPTPWLFMPMFARDFAAVRVIACATSWQ